MPLIKEQLTHRRIMTDRYRNKLICLQINLLRLRYCEKHVDKNFFFLFK